MKMPKKILFMIITIVSLGILIPVLWPLMLGTSSDMAAINGTDAGTVLLRTAWPVVLLLIGIGIAIELVVWTIRRFNVGGRR